LVAAAAAATTTTTTTIGQFSHRLDLVPQNYHNLPKSEQYFLQSECHSGCPTNGIKAATGRFLQ